ncbi:endonuclease/exonuclease/phosphatase family protein [Atopococcus tabaci]|uniref:endonuclease/exonuclease/phosphatase family protein n=1 Tax=Atopococcus tabaci TaxID=269774 RepID=UPI00240A7D18|nr:endonuclease/exonuclease/phosphatase family protein [Atopococcus tabaci]
MKLLTLNTHSWMEEEALEKLTFLCEAIAAQQFDVIALQEVNQSIAAPLVEPSRLLSFEEANKEHPIKEDNFALLLQEKLREKGLSYYWTWEPSHVGYDRYDEGLALLSLNPIEEVSSFFVSENKSYDNYKSRKALGIKSKGHWYFSLHLGWWQDEEEPFSSQWEKAQKVFESLSGLIFLMGDFNNPADQKEEGYDSVSQQWFDTYTLAEEKDNGFTVAKAIDGWIDNQTGLRMDYIFSNHPVPVISSKVIFNGHHYPVISDHFGVAVETNEAC